MSAPSRVLVVDDEKLIRWSVSERLARRGYDVDSASSGEEALEKLAASGPDVMLLDVKLPGIDGVAVLQRALRARPELAVVMMSAHSTVDVAVQAMKVGALDFLVKPFALDALDAAVQRAVDSARTRREIAERVARCVDAGALESLVGGSAAMQEIRSVVARVAASGATTLLVEGESGSGKEVVARTVHCASARCDKPFVQVNCAAMPEQLLESELFGHERGAFTDARVQKRGLFEAADAGTILLDEIGDLPAGGQAKLLRLLETKTFRRVGGVPELRSDVRVIAATNVDLDQRVSEGRFRADLFFRLNVIRIRVPPLRERAEDVALLTAHFIADFDRKMGRDVRGASPAALELLRAYRWPGNVRELRNVVERAFIMDGEAQELRPEHLPAELHAGARATAGSGPAPVPTVAVSPHAPALCLEEHEKRLIADAMRVAGGNQSQAARILGVTRDTLRYRLKKHGMM